MRQHMIRLVPGPQPDSFDNDTYTNISFVVLKNTMFNPMFLLHQPGFEILVAMFRGGSLCQPYPPQGMLTTYHVDHLVYKVTAHGKCHAFFDICAFVWNETLQWKRPSLYFEFACNKLAILLCLLRG